ncbi:Nucleoside triphosphate pyrophosphatase Maf-like protein - like 3 [Theobroma cacao]|nr:Nucleoside triphosphate pyrophosphatase Maf-like protein - like 3 [Theobroma cacao]
MRRTAMWAYLALMCCVPKCICEMLFWWARCNCGICSSYNLKTGFRKGEWDRVEIYFHEIPDEVIEKLIEEGTVLHVAGGLIIEHPLIKPYVKQVPLQTFFKSLKANLRLDSLIVHASNLNSIFLCGRDNRQCDGIAQSSHRETHQGSPLGAASFWVPLMKLKAFDSLC